jgi:hypothetical protein
MMGLVGQRRQLVSEIEELQERKVDLVGRLTGATREQAIVYRQTIGEIDHQLVSARNALGGIDRAIAARQGSPVATPAPPAAEGGQGRQGPQGPQAPQSPQIWQGWETAPPRFPGSDPMPLYLSGGALTLVALAIAVGIAYARRLRRETAAAMERLHADMRMDLQKLTHGVDAMSVELERIGEGQRFVTKALVERKETV